MIVGREQLLPNSPVVSVYTEVVVCYQYLFLVPYYTPTEDSEYRTPAQKGVQWICGLGAF